MKTQQLQLRVSAEQKAAIRLLASKEHQGMSQWILNKILPKPQKDFLKILERLRDCQNHKERSYILNDLNAFFLKLSKHDLVETVSEDYLSALNPLMANYISAMIEHVCVNAQIEPPKWLAQGLPEPFFGSDLLSLRLYLLTVSPPSFRKRNIFIDATVGDLV